MELPAEAAAEQPGRDSQSPAATAGSWRAVPEASATDLENLLGTGVGAAQEQLERNGGFLPFALVVENDGEVRLVAVTPADADEGSDADFDADAMISDLTELLRQNRDEFRAAADRLRHHPGGGRLGRHPRGRRTPGRLRVRRSPSLRSEHRDA